VDEVYLAKWAAKQLSGVQVLRDAVERLWPASEGYPVKLAQVAETLNFVVPEKSQ
jgi:hypothetical protein